MDGIVILDKPPGPTSHDAVATVKKLLGVRKAGHAGTLDPMVSGVLPVTLEGACKVVPALQGADKEYVGILVLHADVADVDLGDAMRAFVGDISQRPPVRSAVARKTRIRTIRVFELLERDHRNVLFRMDCEAGTYVRKAVHDMGSRIGGAHMRELRRIRAGPFFERDAVTLHDLADAVAFMKEGNDEHLRKCVLPVEAAVAHLNKIIVKETAIRSVANGSPLYASGISSSDTITQGERIALMTEDGRLVALARAGEGSIVAQPDRVIMTRKQTNT